ncbi:type III polyketide synthase [Brevibacterium daeguense]|uniref:Type III polyketide synthase n=1 Tax=Brevibacterium daeguense TaxID=909936 RepID=A0ABP8EJ27_9MICO|nr:type III polyketide synthase [Brevibacterium daeguense]
MPVTLRSLQVAVPDTVLIQGEVRDVFAAQPGLSALAIRLIGAAFNSSGIERRFSAVREMSFTAAVEDPDFFDPDSRRILNPTTGTRNDVYVSEAPKLFVEAAAAAIKECEGIDRSDVTHVITVSCTGFCAPGPDYRVVRDVGLNPSVQRYHLGFMGCYAAFPAMRQAKAICDAEPDSVVLIVSGELCSIHVRVADNPDSILGASLFADGAAAAIITGRDLGPGRGLQLDHFETVLTPVGEEAMAWTVGDHGFDMILGSYVPRIVDQHIAGALAPLFAKDRSLEDRQFRDIDHWAIHPGGRSILDKVERRLDLDAEQLEPSRGVLRDYGNMSSATVLFVLKEIFDRPESEAGERVCGMAFGPGLTVESALFTTVGSHQ